MYLALEDKYSRLQGRLMQMKADNHDISRLHLTTASFGMTNGLLEQVHNTDKHKITLLLVHHTRKMYDPDPLNTVSGSTGLIGAVDGAFVLVKDKRTGSDLPEALILHRIWRESNARPTA